MYLSKLNQLKNEIDKLYANTIKVSETVPKCKLDGFELELRHLIARVRNDNAILEKKIYESEYKKII